MKLGIHLAGRRPEDIAERLSSARESGFSLCQLNFHETGLTRPDIVAVADAFEAYDVRPLALGCYVNPMRPDDSSLMGTCRADLDVLLHSLDLLGARRIVLWSGTHSNTWFEPNAQNSNTSSKDLLRTFLESVVASTRARHFTLVLEPNPDHVLATTEDVIEFHRTLAPVVSSHVRYVLDAASHLTANDYPMRGEMAERVCSHLGPLSAVVHLRDFAVQANGECGLTAPGAGGLDYDAYIRHIMRSAPRDTAAIARNVAPDEYADVRDYLLRLSDNWELA